MSIVSSDPYLPILALTLKLALMAKAARSFGKRMNHDLQVLGKGTAYDAKSDVVLRENVID